MLDTFFDVCQTCGGRGIGLGLVLGIAIGIGIALGISELLRRKKS